MMLGRCPHCGHPFDDHVLPAPTNVEPLVVPDACPAKAKL